MFRSCTGPEPGRRSGNPCLDYYIKRCEAPCVGYVTREEYRESIDGVVDFLSGRFANIERELERRMLEAAAEERFEQATLERNRLQAVRSLLERRRVAGASPSTFDAVAVALDGRDANAQVFQVRDGILSDRQSFYLENATEREPAEVAEEFMLQYYGGRGRDPGAAGAPAGARRTRGAARGARQPPRRAARDAGRRARREAAHPRARPAQRGARARPGAPARRAPPPDAGGGARGPPAGARARRSPDPDRVLRHLQPRRHPHGRLDGRVRGGRAEEVRLPALHDPHRGGLLRRLRGDGRGALAALCAVAAPARDLAPRPGLRRELRDAPQPRRDRRRQGPAGGRAGGSWRAFASRACA